MSLVIIGPKFEYCESINPIAVGEENQDRIRKENLSRLDVDIVSTSAYSSAHGTSSKPETEPTILLLAAATATSGK